MNVRQVFAGAALAVLLATPAVTARAQAVAQKLDIKRLALNDAHTVVYATSNDERAYQGEYLADAWKTFREERICERVFEMIASRAPEDKITEIKDRWKEIEEALEPINLQALVDGEEFLAINLMIGPFGHTVMAVRLTEEDAEDYRQGIGNLFDVFQKWSDGKVTAETTDSSGAKVTRLQVPEESPYQPVVACIGDLFIVSTSPELLDRALGQLDDDDAKSKFDDARFKNALEQLPEAEDAITFFDADKFFEGLEDIGDFIRSEKPNDEDAARAADVLEKVIQEVNILEYEAVVEYTEEGRNRVAAFGELSDGIEDTILGKALIEGEAFEDWQSWVPEGATAYSLKGGINLHVLYAGIMEFVRKEFPESKEALDKWAAIQEQVGVNLDEDLLQSFSGECVSITLSDGQTITALKCTNPDKVRELLDRAIEGLKQIPQVAAQGIDLENVDDEALEGFQELKALALASMPTKPVIGFKDGWMILASSPAAAKTFLAVRSGEGESIKGDESLERFGMETDGEAWDVSYTDIGAGVRAIAQAIDQAAMMAPMFVGMATADAAPEDKKLINEAIGLLPSVAKVIRKFDFYEQQLSITREGPEDGTYIREASTLIRQPGEDSGA